MKFEPTHAGSRNSKSTRALIEQYGYSRHKRELEVLKMLKNTGSAFSPGLPPDVEVVTFYPYIAHRFVATTTIVASIWQEAL